MSSQRLSFLLSIFTFHLVYAHLATPTLARNSASARFVGAVYVMSNNATSNTIISYGRNIDGSLTLVDPAIPTGGEGAVINAGIADPLISAFSVVTAFRNKLLLAVNAGSNSVSVFKIRSNYSLRLLSVNEVPGFAPVSIAVAGGLVYVACADDDGDFDSPWDMTGLITGFRLTARGRLVRLSQRPALLSFRPSAIMFSPDRRSLVVSNPFAGNNAVSVGGVEEIFTFRVLQGGRLSTGPADIVTSTVLDNESGRALPGVIGFDVVGDGNVQYVVAPEIRAVTSDGTNSTAQTSSVSTWMLDRDGKLSPVQLDLLVGTSTTEGQLASCWIQFSSDGEAFWVANTGSDSISAFQIVSGLARLENEVAGSGRSPVDMARSPDGKFLYQLFTGEVGVFAVAEDGVNLIDFQRAEGVPEEFAQGIAAI